MGKEPVNIIRLKRQNDAFADAQHHARDLEVSACNARWFSDAFVNANRPQLTAQTNDFIAAETSLIQRHKVGVKDQIAQELSSANQAVAALRKERLRELLHRERMMHEGELNAVGLAFDKHRD